MSERADTEEESDNQSEVSITLDITVGRVNCTVGTFDKIPECP